MPDRPRSAGTPARKDAAAVDRRAEKREARLERQRLEAAARHRRLRRRRARKIGLGALGAVVIGVVAFVLFRPDAEVPGVERPPNRGRGHADGIRYETATPTSGKHPAQSPNCSDYSDELEPGLAVHALEHGAVVVWYRADRADELRPVLSELTEKWDSHVVLSPNDALSSPIVATAWNRLARYETVGDELRRFVDTYRQRGPERESCDIS